MQLYFLTIAIDKNSHDNIYIVFKSPVLDVESLFFYDFSQYIRR